MIRTPFDAIHAHAWSETLDVPSLNARVSTRIRSSIDMLRKTDSNAVNTPKSTVLLLLGPAGSGKTHLFTRLRHQVGCRAIFVHIRPALGIEPSPRHVLAAIVESLCRGVSGRDERQIDVVVGTMLARANEVPSHFPLACLEECRRQTPEMQREIIEKAVAWAEEHSPDVRPGYLSHLLRLPFADRLDQRALWTWLAGREPSQVLLERLAERTGLRDDDILPAIRTLGMVASFGAPLVLVFDQLENLADDEGKTARISEYARVVSELRDTVSGLVIVQMALDAVWMSRIHPVLQPSMRDRLMEHVEYLDAPSPEERVALVRCWLQGLPEDQRAAPFPFPFTSAQLDAWKNDKAMTPRMLMQTCGEAYRSLGAIPSLSGRVGLDERDQRIEETWQGCLRTARTMIDEASALGQGMDPETIRAGIAAAGQVLGRSTETAEFEGIPAVVFPLDDTLVLLMQHAHHRALARALRTAVEYSEKRHVVVVREESLAIPPTWREVNQWVASLENSQRTTWLLIDRESLARMIGLEKLLTSTRSQDVTNAKGEAISLDDVLDWVRKNPACLEWPVVQGVLRRKSRSPATLEAMVRDDKPRIQTEAAPATAGLAVAELRKLKVASIERLVRDVRARDPGVTRASVLQELANGRIRRFGGNIVALEDLWG